MATIQFRPVSLADCKAVRQQVFATDCRNSDLNFMNLMSWRFFFETELAFHNGWLLFRFKAAGHSAYLPPVGVGDCRDILLELMADADAQEEPFRLMGVSEQALTHLHEMFPATFNYTSDRSYTDYVYRRETLAQLSGKKLQAKRNHIHRFEHLYPDYQYRDLIPEMFAECLDLVGKWNRKKEDIAGRLSVEDERQALQFTFDNWNELCGRGGVILVDNRIVAFTYGAPINHDTFDVCVEKADVDYEGAFTVINREFARHLPESFIYINREEDLGIEGLRKAKLSYQPEWLLDKYIVTKKQVDCVQSISSTDKIKP